MTRAEELRRILKDTRDELSKLESEEEYKFNQSLLNKYKFNQSLLNTCWISDNSYGIGERWKTYTRVISYTAYNLQVVQFEEDCEHKFTIDFTDKPSNMFGSYYKKIEESRYMEAWKQFLFSLQCRLRNVGMEL